MFDRRALSMPRRRLFWCSLSSRVAFVVSLAMTLTAFLIFVAISTIRSGLRCLIESILPSRPMRTALNWRAVMPNRRKVALEIVEFSTRLHRRKETTLSAPVQFSIRVQYRRLPISQRRTGLVGEDGAITHEWHRGLFAPDPWRIVFRTNANTLRR